MRYLRIICIAAILYAVVLGTYSLMLTFIHTTDDWKECIAKGGDAMVNMQRSVFEFGRVCVKEVK